MGKVRKSGRGEWIDAKQSRAEQGGQDRWFELGLVVRLLQGKGHSLEGGCQWCCSKPSSPARHSGSATVGLSSPEKPHSAPSKTTSTIPHLTYYPSPMVGHTVSFDASLVINSSSLFSPVATQRRQNSVGLCVPCGGYKCVSLNAITAKITLGIDLSTPPQGL